MSLCAYITPCVSTSVRMFLHVNSTPYVSLRCVCSSGSMLIRVYPSMCISLRVYDPLCALRLRMHVPSTQVPLCVCPLRVYVPSISMFPCLIVSSFLYRLYVYLPCVRVSFCMSPPCVCVLSRLMTPPRIGLCMPPPCLFLSGCFSPHVWPQGYEYIIILLVA